MKEEDSAVASNSSRMAETIKANNGFGKPALMGETDKLGSNVFTHGKRNQGDFFNITLQAIGDHTGRVCSKDMRELVVNGVDNVPTEPSEPKVKTAKDGKQIQPSVHEVKKLSLIHISEPTRPY